VVQHDEAGFVAALEPRPDVATPGCALCGLVGDAFGIENPGDELDRTALVAGRVDGVYPQESLQPVECLVLDGLGGSSCYKQI
jgi:hypothetical protein